VTAPANPAKCNHKEHQMTKAAKKTTTKKPAKKTAAPKANGVAHRAMSEQIVALMRRPKGVTRAEVLELTKWPSVSMQQQAKAAGVKLKVDKSVRPFRYRTSGD
jgi:hypothetical protein